MIKSLLSSVVGSLSMMRFGVLIILSIVIFFSIIIGCMIIMVSVNRPELLSNMSFWGGISSFLGTLLLNAGVFLGVKAYQKKYENGQKNNNSNPNSNLNTTIIS